MTSVFPQSHTIARDRRLGWAGATTPPHQINKQTNTMRTTKRAFPSKEARRITTQRYDDELEPPTTPKNHTRTLALAKAEDFKLLADLQCIFRGRLRARVAAILLAACARAGVEGRPVVECVMPWVDNVGSALRILCEAVGHNSVRCDYWRDYCTPNYKDR